MPKVTRRDFFKVGGAAAAALAGTKKPARAMELEKGESSYNYARTALTREPAYTVSPYGKLKSPLEVYMENEETVVAAAGHPGHPATRGRTSAVDAVSFMITSDPDRVTYPMKRNSDRGSNLFVKISWENALKEISEKIGATISEKGPESVCLVRSEDTHDGLIGRFMDTLGSPSTISNSGDNNKKSGQQLTWGADIETPDFANAEYILNFGSNLYETFPAYAQSVMDGKMDNHAKLVTLDPRMSMTAGLSDEWIPVQPGTDGLVALAMANVIMENGLADQNFINKWTNIAADKLAKHLQQFTVEMAEEHSGIAADTITRIAVDFAKARSATIFTYRGISSHVNGVDTERACMLLPIITGNVEVKGGYCLPRRFKWNAVEPVPPAQADAGSAGMTFPYDVKSEKQPVGVLISCRTNPAFTSTASSYWTEVLKNEKLIPFSVAITSHMNETAALCDIILPEAVFLERAEPVTSPSTLHPWVGAMSPLVEAPEDVKPLSDILRDIIHALDPEGEKGYQKYWAFDDFEEWMTKYFEKVPGLDEEGGYEAIVENGVYPSYGSLNTETGKFLNDDDGPLEAEYGMHEENGFETPSKKIELLSDALNGLPTWKAAANLKKKEEDDLLFVTYKDAYRCGYELHHNKYLAEKSHANHCMINKETAAELEIKDGTLIRLISPVGYLVTRARVTNAIHPGVVAMAVSSGHNKTGSVAEADPHFRPEWSDKTDADVYNNLWWRDNGVNPNEIIPFFRDPIGGGVAYSFAVKVEPAIAGDRYGVIKADLSIHEAFFKTASDQG